MIIIAGPCSIEGPEFIDIAVRLKELGATHIRGGVFKPRSSPFRFSGLGLEALPYLRAAREATGLPMVVEAMSAGQMEALYDYVDIFQVGARNATSTELLKEFGRQKKPVLYKRGMGQTIEEFLMGADFILNEGNQDVILCERGIRTFEPYTRNTFDLSCIAAVKTSSKLPIIADPSHATGRRELVLPVSFGALAAGADGLIVEVHQNPDAALTDGTQSLDFPMFEKLMIGARLYDA